MEWFVWLLIVLWLLLMGGIQIWKEKAPRKSKIAKKLTIALIVLGVIGGIITITYNTWREPSKKETKETKEKDFNDIANRTSDLTIAKLQDQFPSYFVNPERTNEQKQYILSGIERTRGDDPNKILENLIQQIKKIELRIGEDTNNLIQRNKEITVFAQSQGKLDIALDATNKILEYAPEDNFALRERGFINHRLGNIEQAEKDFLKSIDTSKTNLEKAISLNDVGTFYSMIGQYKKAETYLKESYKIGKEIPNSIIIAASSLNLSTLYSDTNNAEDIKLYISEAIIEFEKAGDKKGVAYAQFNLATYYLQHGDMYEAKKRIDILKLTAEDENDELFKSVIYSNLGNYFARLGDYDAAKRYILGAIEIVEKQHLEGGLATDYENLGIIYQKQGDNIKAEDEYYKALVLHKKLNNLPGICGTLMSLSNIYAERKEYDKAKRSLDEAMDIAVKIDRKEYVAGCYAIIGTNYMEQRIYADAEINLNKALSIFIQIDDMIGKAVVLFNLGSIQKERGDKKGAIKLLGDSKECFKQIGLPHMVAMIDSKLNELDIRDINDTNENAPYTYFAKITKCKIPEDQPFVFSLEKVIKNTDMMVNTDGMTSYICFEEGEEILINDFIERVRAHYQKYPPSSEKDVNWFDLVDTKKHILKYKINILFPPKTFYKPTKGGQLLVIAAKGIFEIYEENHKFDNYETFSMDANTIAKRAWITKDAMRLGLIFKKNLYNDDRTQVGFEAENGTVTIYSQEDYPDPLMKKLKLEVEQINQEEKQQDSNST